MMMRTMERCFRRKFAAPVEQANQTACCRCRDSASEKSSRGDLLSYASKAWLKALSPFVVWKGRSFLERSASANVAPSI